MNIIKHRQIVVDDWHPLDDETNIEQLPAGKLIVSLTYWRAHKNALLQRGQALGIRLAPEDDVAEIGNELDNISLIALQFPAFRDGRAYSQARTLRQHFHYSDELRACGNVLRDQVMYMERVGFDSFEIDAKQDLADALNAFNEIEVKYQPSSDEALPLYRRRTA